MERQTRIGSPWYYATSLGLTLFFLCLPLLNQPAQGLAEKRESSPGADKVGEVSGASIQQTQKASSAFTLSWMEHWESDLMKTWVAEQNRTTQDFYDTFKPGIKVGAMYKSLKQSEFIRYAEDGGRFKWVNSANQKTLFFRATDEDEYDEIVDFPVVPGFPSFSIEKVLFSPGDRYAAFLCRVPAEYAHAAPSVLALYDVQEKRQLYDRVLIPSATRHLSFSWSEDGLGFYYFGAIPRELVGEENWNESEHGEGLRFHRIGTSHAKDPLLYRDDTAPEDLYYLTYELEGKASFLVNEISTNDGSSRILLFENAPDPTVSPTVLFESDEAQRWHFIGQHKEEFFFYNSPLVGSGRIVKTSIGDMTADGPTAVVNALERGSIDRYLWWEQGPAALLVGDKLVVNVYANVCNSLHVYTLEGELEQVVNAPQYGTIYLRRAVDEGSAFTFNFTNHTTPYTLYHCALERNATLISYAPTDLPSPYCVKQVFVENDEGVRLPLCIYHRSDIELDGSHPTLLHGYGGFANVTHPQYQADVCCWLELGGVYAYATLRGDGGMGETFRMGGHGRHRKNAVSDFIACADWLVDNKYTSNQRLALFGASNGGLTVAASMIREPELCKAVLIHVGIADLVRLEELEGDYWLSEYGDYTSPEGIDALLSLSPLENISRDTTYPAALITTSYADSTVNPAHSFKLAKKLQNTQAPSVLLRTYDTLTHTQVTHELITERLKFLIKHLGVISTNED